MTINRGLGKQLSRLAHNQEVGGATPSPATSVNRPENSSPPDALPGAVKAVPCFLFA